MFASSLPPVDFSVTDEEIGGPREPLRCHMVDGLICNVLQSGAALRYLRDDYKVEPHEVFIATFPKCGNTWTRKICMEITKHALPFEELSRIYQEGVIADDVAIPYFEKLLSGKIVRACTQKEGLEETGEERGIEEKAGVQCFKQFLQDTAKDTQLPRFWKTHLPATHFPKNLDDKSKMIIVQRDPKDCMVSAYHYYSSAQSVARGAGFKGSFAEWHRLFMNGLMWYNSVWDWYAGMKALAEQRPEGTVLWLHYEDMVKDPESAVRRMIEFLGFDEKRYPDEVMADILEKISFKHCNKVKKEGKEIHMTGGVQKALFRKGKAGDWRNHLTEAQSQECDMVTLVKFDGTGFPYVDQVRKEQRKLREKGSQEKDKEEQEQHTTAGSECQAVPQKRPEGVTREEFRDESTLEVFA